MMRRWSFDIWFGVLIRWTNLKPIEPCEEKRVEAAYSNADAAPQRVRVDEMTDNHM